MAYFIREYDTDSDEYRLWQLYDDRAPHAGSKIFFCLEYNEPTLWEGRELYLKQTISAIYFENPMSPQEFIAFCNGETGHTAATMLVTQNYLPPNLFKDLAEDGERYMCMFADYLNQPKYPQTPTSGTKLADALRARGPAGQSAHEWRRRINPLLKTAMDDVMADRFIPASDDNRLTAAQVGFIMKPLEPRFIRRAGTVPVQAFPGAGGPAEEEKILYPRYDIYYQFGDGHQAAFRASPRTVQNRGLAMDYIGYICKSERAPDGSALLEPKRHIYNWLRRMHDIPGVWLCDIHEKLAKNGNAQATCSDIRKELIRSRQWQAAGQRTAQRWPVMGETADISFFHTIALLAEVEGCEGETFAEKATTHAISDLMFRNRTPDRFHAVEILERDGRQVAWFSLAASECGATQGRMRGFMEGKFDFLYGSEIVPRGAGRQIGDASAKLMFH